MKTKKNDNSKITDKLPVLELSLEEQIETDGGGEDRTGDKQTDWWGKFKEMFLG